MNFETTGLSAEKNSIIQIATVRYRNFEKIDEFFTYINPILETPPKITRISGIA
ncbi:exonuclease domain-containing protein [Lysinibacillus sp. CTST325]